MGIVRDVTQQALPRFTGARPFWAVVRGKGKWESIAGGLEESPDKVRADVERLADQALKRFEGSTGEAEGMEWDGRVYYPLVVGETTTGIVAVETTGENGTREDTDWRRELASATTLVAIAARNVQLAREVEENGVYDGLTGCFNRTHSMRVLQTELQRARRQQAPVALIMLDLDHFKEINALVGRADAALYRAKNGGRNQVCEAELPETSPLVGSP